MKTDLFNVNSEIQSETSIENQNSQLDNVGLSSFAITIHSPLIPFEDKYFFLKNYISDYTVAIYDGKNNIVKLDIHNPKPETLFDKLLNRVGDYLKTGKISLGSMKIGNQERAIAELRDMIDLLNMRFNLYVRANDDLCEKIANKLKIGKKEFDEQYLNINQFLINSENKPNNENNVLPYNTIVDGVSADWSVRIWQTDFINACRTRFLWCNAYGTGLGKTSTSLLAVQDRQNQYNERALFTVPASSLNKWFKEAFVGTYKNQKQIKPSVLIKSVADKTLFIDLLPSSEFKQIAKLNKNQLQKRYPNDALMSYIHDNIEQFEYLKLSIDEQLQKALLKDKQGNYIYDKIFMSHEHFYRIRLKEQSTSEFIKEQVNSDDGLSRYDLYCKKINLWKKVIHEESVGKNKLDVFLEDMNIDILVVDEGHSFKNNKEVHMSSNDGINYGSVRFFPNGNVSNRGIDMAAKCHYIRSKSKTKEGILILTATPVTNSPVEIYSMLSLILGEYFINKIFGINGISEFLGLFCVVQQQEEAGVDDTISFSPVFTGLNNLKLLHEILHRTIYYVDENDDRVQGSIKLPNRNNLDIIETMNQYQEYEVRNLKNCYQIAKKIISEINELDDTSNFTQEDLNTIIDTIADTQAPMFREYLTRFNEDVEITSSTFNLMSKFENLILDEDLLESATVFFLPNAIKSSISEAIEIFNKKTFKYAKTRLNPLTNSQSVLKVSEKIKTNKYGDEKTYTEYQIHSVAYDIDLSNSKNLKDKRLSENQINTIQRILKYTSANQKMAEKNHNNLINNELSIYSNNVIDFKNDMMIVIDGFDYESQIFLFNTIVHCLTKNNKKSELDNLKYLLNNIKFNLSPKVMSCLNKLVMENNNPRGKNHDGCHTDLVKQLIFCDGLGIHFKLSVLIHKFTQIPYHKITHLTGVVNGDNDEVLQLQDYFNAEDEENKYQIVIANQKGEYAIDLQNGTQAIHLLTINWTPDSETQRVGRAARQGNQTDYINIYHYYTERTFDEYKRKIVSVKDNWIGKLFSGKIDYLTIVQGLSKEQQEHLIMMMGDVSEEEMQAFENEVAKSNELREINRIKKEQNMLLDFILNNPFDTQTSEKDKQNQNIIKYQEHYIKEYVEIQLNRADKIETLVKMFDRNNKEFYKHDKVDVDNLFLNIKNMDFVNDHVFWSNLGISDFNFRLFFEICRDSKLFSNTELHNLNTLILLNKHNNELINEKLINFKFLFNSNGNAYSIQSNLNKFNQFIALCKEYDIAYLKEQEQEYVLKYYYLNNWVLHILVGKLVRYGKTAKQLELLKNDLYHFLLNSLLSLDTDYFNAKNFNKNQNNHGYFDDSLLLSQFNSQSEIVNKLRDTAIQSYNDLCKNELKNNGGVRLSYSPKIFNYKNTISKNNNELIFPEVVKLIAPERIQMQDVVEQLSNIVNGGTYIDNIIGSKKRDNLWLLSTSEMINKFKNKMLSENDKSIHELISIGSNLFAYFKHNGINVVSYEKTGNEKIYSIYNFGEMDLDWESNSKNEMLKSLSFFGCIPFFKKQEQFYFAKRNHVGFNSQQEYREHLNSLDSRYVLDSANTLTVQPNLPLYQDNYKLLKEVIEIIELFLLLRTSMYKKMKHYKNVLEYLSFGDEFKDYDVNKKFDLVSDNFECFKDNGVQKWKEIGQGIIQGVYNEYQSLKQQDIEKRKRSEELKRQKLAELEQRLRERNNASGANSELENVINNLITDFQAQELNPIVSQQNGTNANNVDDKYIIGDYLNIILSLDDEQVVCFTSPKSYDLYSDVKFREVAEKFKIDNEIFFYYGVAPKDNNAAKKKLLAELGITLEQLDKFNMRNAWGMTVKLLRHIIEKMKKCYKPEQFNEHMKNLKFYIL